MSTPVRSGRRGLTYAVLLGLAGAGLAAYAATRGWAVEVTVRPEPLPPLRVSRTGGDLLPWLPALALVGLAGAGAVLASRGLGRRLVGGLLLLADAGVVAGGGYGLLAPPSGEHGPTWPALCVLGGLLAGAGATATLLRGHTWPAMGARYERRVPDGRTSATHGDDPAAPGGTGRTYARRTSDAWDALDRGEDPTVG